MLFKCTIYFPSGALRDNTSLISALDNHVRRSFPFMEEYRSHTVLTEMKFTLWIMWFTVVAWVGSSTCLAFKQNKNLMDTILKTPFKVTKVKKSSQVNSDNLWRGSVEVRFTVLAFNSFVPQYFPRAAHSMTSITHITDLWLTTAPRHAPWSSSLLAQYNQLTWISLMDPFSFFNHQPLVPSHCLSI